MDAYFWKSFWANAGFAAACTLAVVLGSLGVRWWRRWRKLRRIKRDLEYVAPEIKEQRRAEMMIEAGLIPGAVMGYGPMAPPLPPGGATPTCPHCGLPIDVIVTMPYPKIEVPMGPDASGPHPLPPGPPTYQHWCGTCRAGAKGYHVHKHKPIGPGEESGATDA